MLVTQPPLPTGGSRPSRATAFLRSLLWIGFGIILALVVALAGSSIFLLGAGPIGLIAAAIAAAALILFLRRMPFRGWVRLGIAYAALVPVLLYLVIDDTSIRRPMPLEEISPSFEGAEKSYDVVMRYGKQHPLGQNFRLPSSAKLTAGTGGWKPRDPEWRTWLNSNRPELESNWAQLEPVRTWWTELNTFDQIGDLTPARMDAELITFAPFRAISQHACAIASLQAIDGKGDAAFETLLPILQVSRKLEPSSRTLVRFMVARVMQKLALEAATFVLDTTPVSPAARARFASALTGGCGGEDGARRLVSVEYAWAFTVTCQRENFPFFAAKDETVRWLSRVAGPLNRFVFNPRRTINLYADLTADLEKLAIHREFAQLDALPNDFLEQHCRAQFKNIAGSALLSYLTPSYKKILEAYWTTEDLRAALNTRLRA
jgi:hypothetical protein